MEQVVMWGMERDQSSPAFGEVVVGGPGQTPIFLWDKPGKFVKLSGALKHGDKVKVLDKKFKSGQMYYKVECTISHEGKDYPQCGWVSKRLIKND